LYLSDAQGRLIGQSTKSGNASEQISLPIEAGDYYLTVVAKSFRSISYQLNLSARVQPVTTPVVVQRPTTETGSSGSQVTPLPDVSYFGGSREWNLNAINAPEAWAKGYTGQGVTVAIVDTGVDLDHPDLVNNLYVNPGEIRGNGIDDDRNGFIDDVSGYDFADRDSNADDVVGHGTHVAGTIAASNNGFGATGVAPGAKILPVRVLGADGSGNTSDVAAGIRYAADLGADIINLSLGGDYSRAVETAIDYARSLGSLVIAAAGNESATTPSYPARFSASDDNVISVGASTTSGSIASFSNDVGLSRAIQVDAPGVGIYSTYVGGGYATLSGTSMAAPHVAGLAALTLSANPSLTTRQLRDLLASGTVGRATGSDAIGNINATTTVAYAAAGITGGTRLADARSVTSSINQSSSAQTQRTTSIDQITTAADQDFARKNTPTHQESLFLEVLEQLIPAKRFRASPSYASYPQQHVEAIDLVMSEPSDIVPSEPSDFVATSGLTHLR
jgi:subtilisin family serine protease